MTNLLEVVGAITVLLFGLIGGTAVLYCTLLGMKLCWSRLFEVEAKTASSVRVPATDYYDAGRGE